MRSFICLTISALAAVATASSTANPFEIPAAGYTFSVGEATTLKWDPTTSGTVTLRLQQGAVTTANEGTAIASDIDNDGSYTWTVPDNVNTEWYTIEIISDDDSSDYNFLPRFTVAGATAAASTTTPAATSTTTSKSTTSTSSTETKTSSSAATTMTTKTTSTETKTKSSSTAASTSADSTTTSSSSTASASSSPTSVPATGAGLVNRVSGGMMAIVAAAIAFL